MSELKATTVYDAYWKANSIGEGTGILVYIKSEADKVIAEKDKVIAYAQALVLKDIEIIRHQKFKRCLAMADMCRESLCFWDNVKYTYFKGEEYCFRKLNHYGKWGQIWLAIAEKFEEAE